ncbi:WG repeat-containing protein [Algivirga pacifica]|uniref:WG containing repeat-containing protein n=1 Tax=Algivirga pacifica TaxID=1162670 RepID=A0ABP9DM34_9BACT
MKIQRALLSLFFLLTIFCSISVHAQSIESVTKYFEKHDYKKGKERLDKWIRKKGASVETHYLLSLYYSYPGNMSYYFLDSAYHYSLKGIETWKGLSTELKQELIDEQDFSLVLLEKQKEKIEHTAFDIAVQLNTEKAYAEYYLDYPQAEYQEVAAVRRDSLGFLKAQLEDTYQAYASFLKKYPEAKQVKKAQEAYHLNLYQTLTEDNTVVSLSAFIERYADSPYINEAEQRLWQVLVYDHSEEAYKNFVRAYPHSSLAKQGWYALWYKYEDKSLFWRQYPDAPAYFRLLQQVDRESYLPFFDKDKKRYGFFNAQGEVKVAAMTTTISDDARCKGVSEDYIMISDEQNKWGTVDKLGNVTLPFIFDEIKPFDQEILKVRKGMHWGLFHKGGFEVIPCQYDVITPLITGLVILQRDNTTFLSSYYDQRVLWALTYKVSRLNEYLLQLEEQGKYALLSIFDLFNSSEWEPFFEYDEIEWVDEKYILAYKEDKINLLKATGELLFSEVNEVAYTSAGWFVQKDTVFQLFNEEGNLLSEKRYEKVSVGAIGTVVKQGTQWGLLNDQAEELIPLTYDSAFFWGAEGVMLLKGKEKWGYFGEQELLSLTQYEGMQLVFGYRQAEDQLLRQPFIISKNRKKRFMLSDQDGNVLLKPIYQEIKILNETVVVAKNMRGEYEAFNLQGKKLIPSSYDGIVAASKKGTYALLNNKKFGLFDVKGTLNISAEYDVLLQPFGEKEPYYIAKQDKFGIIDQQGKTIVPFEFEELTYWNDSVALVKADQYWKLYHIHKHYFLTESFESYEEVVTSSKEKLLITYRNSGYGVLSNQQGRLILEEFSDIMIMGSEDNPIFFVERAINQVGLYVLLYFDRNGELLREDILREKLYQQISCVE